MESPSSWNGWLAEAGQHGGGRARSLRVAGCRRCTVASAAPLGGAAAVKDSEVSLVHGGCRKGVAAVQGAQVSRLLIAHFPPTFPLEGVQ